MLPSGLIKMLISDSFENNVIQLSIVFVVIAIFCFAWWSTNITDQPHYRTIVYRRIRRRSRNRLTTHIQSTQIAEGTEVSETSSIAENSQSGESVQISNKPPEASTSTNNNNNIRENHNHIEDEEIEDIFRIMDADPSGVRQRRLAYYENRGGGSSTAQPAPSTTAPDTDFKETVKVEQHEPEPVEVIPQLNESIGDNSSNIRIKLKYLTDELKLVDGRLEEQLGDFKKRHFQVEYSSNKIVRLIFNGQVLQTDTATLQTCGLFDNCVVHCLVHQQRTLPVTNDDNSNFNSSSRTNDNPEVSHNQQPVREWDLSNVFFVLISLMLGSAWYFRYEYGQLFTATATVALVAITGIFTIFLIGIYFPDNEPRVDIHTVRT